MKHSREFLAVAASLLSCAVAHAGYSAVGDFSISSNPNGQWSYLYNSGSGPTLLPFGENPAEGVTNLEGWINNPNASIPDIYFIGKNTSSSSISYGTIVQPPNLLRMDPESSTLITQWTAPSAGNWTVNGLFQGIAINEHSHMVQILENNSTVLLTPIAVSSFGQQVPFSYSLTLSAGDTIDFAVS